MRSRAITPKKKETVFEWGTSAALHFTTAIGLLGNPRYINR